MPASDATPIVGKLDSVGLPDGDLAAIAAELGSDVPYFLRGGTARATGRGEVIEALDVFGSVPAWLPGDERLWIVVALSIFSVGGLFSVVEGIRKINHPHPIENALASYIALGIAFLLASYRFDVTILGAFVAPLSLMLFLASGLGSSYAPVSPRVESAMLSLHILANVLGLVAFATPGAFDQ